MIDIKNGWSWNVQELYRMITSGEGADVEPGAAVADATDTTDVVEQFNALLASLRTAGFISAT